MGNRWAGFVAPGTGTQTVSLLEAAHPESPPVLRGAQAPQQGVSAPDGDRRLERFPTSSAGPYWLGAHGGAGETTFRELLGGVECHHRWPSPTPEAPSAVVVLLARQTHGGLEAARRAAQDWASGQHPEVVLAGLVIVAGTPGKTPKPLAAATRVISGGVPSTWVVPWIEELRLTGATDWESMAREPRKVLTALGEAVDELISERTPQ
ncbi:DUF6668 family protein [Kocuria sp. M4R2S49]|uniref:DUF6668 family protein n=1 Tax=Kocuria rhizosphaericola TaxID=3376284 RepID=UPI0037B3B65A